MHDIKWIRENPQAFDEGLKKRGLAPQSAELIALDKARREAQTRAQEIQQERNALSKQIGIAKSKGEDAAELLEKVSASKAAEEDAESEADARKAELDTALEGIPNTPAEGVPEGADEAANEEIAAWGGKPNLSFEPKEHFEIGESLGAMDFERAAKLSGSRFVVLTGPLARLERALAQFMLDLQTNEFGYNEVSPPVLVRDEALYGTGQLPKFAEDLFRIPDFPPLTEELVSQFAWEGGDREMTAALIGSGLNTGETTKAERSERQQSAIIRGQRKLIETYIELSRSGQRWLIPTAEVPLTNLVAG